MQTAQLKHSLRRRVMELEYARRQLDRPRALVLTLTGIFLLLVIWAALAHISMVVRAELFGSGPSTPSSEGVNTVDGAEKWSFYPGFSEGGEPPRNDGPNPCHRRGVLGPVRHRGHCPGRAI
ncbi:MAG: hypothetical protein MO853_08590 [Candidatus Protistobacter heckmanni]|nr:hypothetical protein [Candidatus Protistobacter heckmanni]